jgi:hypothetical protein
MTDPVLISHPCTVLHSTHAIAAYKEVSRGSQPAALRAGMEAYRHVIVGPHTASKCTGSTSYTASHVLTQTVLPAVRV